MKKNKKEISNKTYSNLKFEIGVPETISKKSKIPPPFTLEFGSIANNIEKQLKNKKIKFDPSVIKLHDNLIKSIVVLRNEKFISEKQSFKLIYDIFEKSISHIYFIYENL
jgi:hypothetical protein